MKKIYQIKSTAPVKVPTIAWLLIDGIAKAREVTTESVCNVVTVDQHGNLYESTELVPWVDGILAPLMPNFLFSHPDTPEGHAAFQDLWADLRPAIQAGEPIDRFKMIDEVELADIPA
ncbi:hypothetical protein [Desulfosarcina ovata]|uniref:Uncharacterized protein n=1 Tax=Desulfosarcina ovata subsp. ovata TaxID=2752305 RepID=A0A5K8AK80_9BACT|nr:hypothetical protein [Desulfosarcina ovata]BBO92064.1 hypothetical protein DSCOOX_52440 [Desulfosarcina ovata subsp. ovata]